MTTTLLFPSAVDPERTKIVGGEGRFEDLMIGGRVLVILPTKNLAANEHFSMPVVLMDGRKFPFSIAPVGWEPGQGLDGQVDVHEWLDPRSPEALKKELDEQRSLINSLSGENERRQREEISIDHALAALLVRGELALTPFERSDSRYLKDGSVDIRIKTFVSKPNDESLPAKVAVAIQVGNGDATKPWRLEQAQLMTYLEQEERPIAVRAFPEAIAPQSTGHIAIVTSSSAFIYQGEIVKLVLDIFRDGGERQLHVELALTKGKRVKIVGVPRFNTFQ